MKLSLAPALLLLLAFLPLGCKKAAPEYGTGDEWLSWSQEQKSAFVLGYISGQAMASTELCEMHLDTYIPEGTKFPAGASDPADLCRKDVRAYSQLKPATGNFVAPNTEPYTSTMDAFYKHSECRMLPYTILIEHLDDSEFRAGEQFYQHVHNGPLKKSWGFFSGFEGLDRCLKR